MVVTLGIAGCSELLQARASSPAVAPRQGAPLRLGANENPNGLGPAALEAVRGGIVDANRYPGQSVQRLMAELARAHDVPSEQVLVTRGSGEILRAPRPWPSPAPRVRS